MNVDLDTLQKDVFIRDYMIAFMASWAAANFDNFCAEGRHERLTSKGMVDEAKFMAEEVWENLSK